MGLKELQNLSDIRGIVINDIPGEEINLTETEVKKLSKGYISWLLHDEKNKGKVLKIAVSNDIRIKGPEFKTTAIDTILNLGHDIIDCGVLPTPAVQFATKKGFINCDGAIAFTASHLPYNRNGLKFFTKNCGINSRDLENIIKLAEGEGEGSTDQVNTGKLERKNIMKHYCNHLSSYIKNKIKNTKNYDKPLEGLKIIVDAGNGTGGFFAENILKPLGADTSGSMYLNPDGNFPNHQPNTEDPEVIIPLQKTVIDKNADLGILFDSDVDRAAFADNKGNPIMGSTLVALISSIILKENPKSRIVTDSITSDYLTEFIQKKLNGIHHRFRRGYRRVIDEAVRLNKEDLECAVAIETSGHAAFKENNFIDDGAFLALIIIIKLAELKQEGGKDICDLYSDFNAPKENHQFRLKILTPNIEAESNKILQSLKRFAATVPGWRIVVNNFDGLRITAEKFYGDGWLHIRHSIHEPVLVLNVESNSQKGIKMTLNRILKLLSKINTIDSSMLHKYLEENK